MIKVTEKTIKIVKKGTKEFVEARLQFQKLFSTEEPEDTIKPGNVGMKTTQIDKLSKIPMPFGCSDLELYVWHKDETEDGLNHVAYFCSRLGCLCTCAREDVPGEENSYPNYCPNLDEMFWDDSYDEDPGYDEDFLDEYWDGYDPLIW